MQLHDSGVIIVVCFFCLVNYVFPVFKVFSSFSSLSFTIWFTVFIWGINLEFSLLNL